MKPLNNIIYIIIPLISLQMAGNAVALYDNKNFDLNNNTTTSNTTSFYGKNNINTFDTINLKPTEIYNQNVKSMVYITTQDKQGSGVFIDYNGTFLTCFHVIKNADYITIKTHDGKTYNVNGFKYINPTDDIAILTIDAPYAKFKPIDISKTKLQIGEKIYTISNPEGFEFAFSDGLINQYKDEYIQFSAPISSGSSGGALLNEKGELLGIITSTYVNAQNINFALPNNCYVSKINNLPIKNLYNKNWTEFLLSNTDSSQFKITGEYGFSEDIKFEEYYNNMKDYIDLPNFPVHYYALAATYAAFAYYETENKTALKDSIRWFELSIRNNVNAELSLYTLYMLYLLDDNIELSWWCLEKLYEQYPESYTVIRKLETCAESEITEILWKHFYKLLAELVNTIERMGR